jgi:hypothetical protein
LSYLPALDQLQTSLVNHTLRYIYQLLARIKQQPQLTNIWVGDCGSYTFQVYHRTNRIATLRLQNEASTTMMMMYRAKIPLSRDPIRGVYVNLSVLPLIYFPHLTWIDWDLLYHQYLNPALEEKDVMIEWPQTCWFCTRKPYIQDYIIPVPYLLCETHLQNSLCLTLLLCELIGR